MNSTTILVHITKRGPTKSKPCPISAFPGLVYIYEKLDNEDNLWETNSIVIKQSYPNQNQEFEKTKEKKITRFEKEFIHHQLSSLIALLY